jgi:hypothetical protein
MAGLPAIAEPKPGRQTQRLSDSSGQAIHAHVEANKKATLLLIFKLILYEKSVIVIS